MSQPKRLLILSSNGGYGHGAAVNALKQSLGEGYEMKIYYPINTIHLLGFPIREKIYNDLVRKGWIRTTNFLARYLAPNVFKICAKEIEQNVSRWIEEEKPDLVVSVIPYVNYPASEAARKAGLPFLLITVDNDLTNWVHGFKKLNHPHFKVTIGADLPLTRDLLVQSGVPNEQIETIGLPIRQEFCTPNQDREALKKKYGIAEDQPVILIMMGGMGGRSAIAYAESICEMDHNVHVIVIAGRDEKLKAELEEILPCYSNTLTVFGFTDKVAELMTIADLILTKPGPGTINEAISMRLPVFLDSSVSTLYWERANIDLVTRYAIGGSIRRCWQVDQLIEKFFQDDDYRNKLKEALNNTQVSLFHDRMPELVSKMCLIKTAP